MVHKPVFNIADIAVEDDCHRELKRKLKNGIDRDELERFRESVSQLREVKDGKVGVF